LLKESVKGDWRRGINIAMEHKMHQRVNRGRHLEKQVTPERGD
jgi:hypothetical protein